MKFYQVTSGTCHFVYQTIKALLVKMSINAQRSASYWPCFNLQRNNTKVIWWVAMSGGWCRVMDGGGLGCGELGRGWGDGDRGLGCGECVLDEHQGEHCTHCGHYDERSSA